MTWLTTEPPKDAQFLADVGLPYAVVAAWNGRGNEYVYCNFQVDTYKDESEIYFESDYTSTIKKWMPLPDIYTRIPIMYRPDWGNAPEWARYTAQDSDVGWTWYEFDPTFIDCEWVSSGGRTASAYVNNCDKSLEERP